MLGQVLLDLRDHVAVVCAVLVEVEDRRGAGGASTRNCELHPVLHRDVAHARHTPNVAGLHLVLHERVAAAVCNGDRAALGQLERRRVRAVLLGLLGHQAHVRHGADRCRVQRSVLLVVIDDRLVHRAVGAIGDQRERLRLPAVGVPHLARVADHDRHRRVDDDVVRGVQVGDALVGIDHRERGALGVDRRQICLDLGARGERTRAEVRVRARLLQQLVAVEHRHRMPEQDRVRHLHHRRLEVQRQQQVFVLGDVDLLGVEVAQSGRAHERAVDDLASEHVDPILEHVAVQGDRERVVGVHHDRLLVAVEVA